MPEWLLPVILLAVLALVLVLAVVAWIRIRWRSRSFTAVSGAVFDASPDEIWRALSDEKRPSMPAPAFDGIHWLEGLDLPRSPGSGPARQLMEMTGGAVEIAWTVLDDQRPESIAYRYEIGRGIFRGICELQLEPGDEVDPDHAGDAAGAASKATADEPFDSTARPTRVVVIHHCDPTWQEGRAVARQPDREHAFGMQFLRILGARLEAMTGEPARDWQRLGVQFVRGPLVPRGDIPV